MALHNLKITVIDGGKGAGGGGSGTDADSGKNTWRKDVKKSAFYRWTHKTQEIREKMNKTQAGATTLFAIQSGVNLATQTAKQFINYYVSDVGRKHGDSNYQAITNRRIEVVTDSMSLGQGFLSGAMAGSMLGPLGAGIGAVVGTVSAGMGLGFKYAERERAYQHEIFKDNNSQAYNLARANFSAMTGRVR